MDNTPIFWAHKIFHFSHTATSPLWISATEGPGLVDPNDPGKDPRFRALVEAVLFSRGFLLTYNLVLAWILLVFTAWHWGEKAVLARRQRQETLGRECIEWVNEAW